MVMRKNGIIRIIEATIAIIIIMGFLVVVQVKNVPVNEEDYSSKAYAIIEEISANITLRSEILNAEEGFISEGQTYDFVQSNIKESYLESRIKVCGEIDKICSLDRYVGNNVYSAERVIVSSVNDQEFKDKKIKIFIWRDDES